MKIIADNKIISVSSTSVNGEFPISLLLNNHPTDISKAADGINGVTLTFGMSAGTSGMGIFNTNAVSIENITVEDPNYVEWFNGTQWFNGTEWNVNKSSPVASMGTIGKSKSIWIDYDYANSPMVIKMLLTALPSETFYAGTAFGGYVYKIKDPSFGIKQGLKDFGIYNQLSNGASDYEYINVVRTFNGTITEVDDNEFYTFSQTIGRAKGKNPMAFRLTGKSSFEWVVFAHFEQFPEGTFSDRNYIPTTFSLQEEV